MKEFTNNDLTWAREKLRRITDDPLMLVAILEDKLHQYRSKKFLQDYEEKYARQASDELKRLFKREGKDGEK